MEDGEYRYMGNKGNPYGRPAVVREIWEIVKIGKFL